MLRGMFYVPLSAFLQPPQNVFMHAGEMACGGTLFSKRRPFAF